MNVIKHISQRVLFLLILLSTAANALPPKIYVGFNILYAHLDSESFTAYTAPIPNTISLHFRHFKLSSSEPGIAIYGGFITPIAKSFQLHSEVELSLLNNFKEKFSSVIDYPSSISPVDNYFSTNVSIKTIYLKVAPYYNINSHISVFSTLGLGIARIDTDNTFYVQGENNIDSKHILTNNLALQLGTGLTVKVSQHLHLNLHVTYSILGAAHFGSNYYSTPGISKGITIAYNNLNFLTSGIGMDYII